MSTHPRCRAVIFDMDGLMLDTEVVYRIAMHRAAKDFACTLPDELFAQTIGVRSADCRHLFAAIVGETRVDDFFASWRRHEADYSSKNAIVKKAGIDEILALLNRHNIPRIVATSTRRPRAVPRLESTGLLQHFPALVCGDEITNGKPAPDIFLAAAKALAIPPAQCLVLEDSEAGARAAHAAGCTPIIVPDLKQPSLEVRSLAYATVPNLLAAIPIISELLAITPSPPVPSSCPTASEIV